MGRKKFIRDPVVSYYKVRCTNTGEVITVHAASHIWNEYVGWLVINPYRCRFEETSQAEYETLKAFLEKAADEIS